MGRRDPRATIRPSRGLKGWGNFDAPEWKPDVTDRPLLRAAFETLPDGYHLLVGKDIDDLGDLDEQPF